MNVLKLSRNILRKNNIYLQRNFKTIPKCLSKNNNQDTDLPHEHNEAWETMNRVILAGKVSEGFCPQNKSIRIYLRKHLDISVAVRPNSRHVEEILSTVKEDMNVQVTGTLEQEKAVKVITKKDKSKVLRTDYLNFVLADTAKIFSKDEIYENIKRQTEYLKGKNSYPQI